MTSIIIMNRCISLFLFLFICVSVIGQDLLWKRVGNTNSNVHDFCVSKSGTYLFATDLNRVNLFNLRNCDLIETINAFDSTAIYSLALSKDSLYLVAGTSAGRIYLYNFSSHKSTALGILHSKITCVDINAGNKTVAFGTFSGQTGILSMEGIQIRKFSLHNDLVTRVSLSLDGKYLASSGMDGKIMIYYLQDSARQICLINKKKSCRSIMFSENSSYLIAGFDDGSMIQWKVGPSGIFSSVSTRWMTGWITSVAFDINDYIMAACTIEGRILISTQFGYYEKNLHLPFNQVKFASVKLPVLSVLVSAFNSGLYLIPASSLNYSGNNN